MSTIKKILDAHTKTASAEEIIADFIKGAGSHAVEVNREGAEVKLAAASVSPLTVAQLAGALRACDEAGLSSKEASEYLATPESLLAAVREVALK